MKFIWNKPPGTGGRRHNHPKKNRAQNDIWYEIRMNGVSHDQWGVCMSWMYGIANFILSNGGTVPDSWGFRTGAGGIEKTDEYRSLRAIRATVKDALTVGRTLDRWAEMLKKRGKDY
jgi:hypothetical protein